MGTFNFSFPLFLEKSGEKIVALKEFLRFNSLTKRESANSPAILRNMRGRTCAFLWLRTAENRDEILSRRQNPVQGIVKKHPRKNV